MAASLFPSLNTGDQYTAAHSAALKTAGDAHAALLDGITTLSNQPLLDALGRKFGIFPAWDGRPVFYALMGDSITDNLDDTAIQNSLTSDYVVLNKGMGGNTTGQMVARFQTDIVAPFNRSTYSYGVLVLMGGRNDAGTNDPAATAARLFSMVAAAFAAGFSIVIMCTCLPTSNPASENAFLTNLSNLIRAQVGASGATLYDVTAIVPELTDPTNTTYYVDGTHPNATGNIKLLKGQIDTVNPLLITRHLPTAASGYSTAIGAYPTLTALGNASLSNDILTWTGYNKPYSTNGAGSSTAATRCFAEFVINQANGVEFEVGLSVDPTTTQAFAPMLGLYGGNGDIKPRGSVIGYNNNSDGTLTAVGDLMRIQVDFALNNQSRVTCWKNGNMFANYTVAIPAGVLKLDITMGSPISPATTGSFKNLRFYAANPA